MVDRAEDNKAPTRNAPNSDREPQRSRGPDDRLAPPHRGEMNRKTVPGRESAAPSSLAPVANRFGITDQKNLQPTSATKSAKSRHAGYFDSRLTCCSTTTGQCESKCRAR